MSDDRKKPAQSASSANCGGHGLKVETVKISKATSEALKTTVTRRDLGRK